MDFRAFKEFDAKTQKGAGDHVMDMTLIATRVDDSDPSLFVIGTGASRSPMDSSFAAAVTKLHADGSVHVKGLSGKVDKVFEINEAWIQFARFRQKNVGFTAIDLNRRAVRQRVRIAGLMRLPLLNLFRLTLDYRNGQVRFDPL